MEENFDPHNWLDDKPEKQQQQNEPGSFSLDLKPQVEKLIKKIELAGIDLTSSYENWRNIGFALADELREGGRDFFHRISRFYSGYSQEECNKQYDHCLKSNNHGIGIKTLFFIARNAGIFIYDKEPLSGNEKQEDEEITIMPVIFKCHDADLYEIDKKDIKDKKDTENKKDIKFEKNNNLPIPVFLQKVIDVGVSSEEMDILFLGAVGCISACLPNIYGIYDGKKVYPNLFIFVTAPASSGKGRLVMCQDLVREVHRKMREEAKTMKGTYEQQVAEFNLNKSQDKSLERPRKPPEKMLFIPANNSSTGAYQLLHDSDGKGLIFETEGDTLSQAFKTDYGNYSDGFRKAFHHEEITYYRRGDREYVSIENTQLSAVLSGTSRQIVSMIPEAENGLFSRFIFYFMNFNPRWRDVFATKCENGMGEYFAQLGKDFLKFYEMLETGPERRFCLTSHQAGYFNNYFSGLQEHFLCLQGLDYIASIRRLGLIAFRLCMILTSLRIMEKWIDPNRMYCSDEDFHSVMKIVSILVKHSSKVYSEVIPAQAPIVRRKNRKEKLIDSLPDFFTREQAYKIGEEIGLANNSVKSYLTDFYRNGLIETGKTVGSYLKIKISSSFESN